MRVDVRKWTVLASWLASTAALCSGCEGEARSASDAPRTTATPSDAERTTPSSHAGAAPASDSPVPTSPEDAPTPSSTATGTALEGRWSSPRCGARSYERVLSLRAGKLVVEDRVAPCPPGAKCVWSGVVVRRGSYRVAGSTLILELEELAQSGPSLAPLPASMRLDPGPVEQPEGTAEPGCRYVLR